MVTKCATNPPADLVYYWDNPLKLDKSVSQSEINMLESMTQLKRLLQLPACKKGTKEVDFSHLRSAVRDTFKQHLRFQHDIVTTATDHPFLSFWSSIYMSSPYVVKKADGTTRNIAFDVDGDGVHDGIDAFSKNKVYSSDKDEDGVPDELDYDPEDPNIFIFPASIKENNIKMSGNKHILQTRLRIARGPDLSEAEFTKTLKKWNAEIDPYIVKSLVGDDGNVGWEIELIPATSQHKADVTLHKSKPASIPKYALATQYDWIVKNSVSTVVHESGHWVGWPDTYYYYNMPDMPNDDLLVLLQKRYFTPKHHFMGHLSESKDIIPAKDLRFYMAQQSEWTKQLVRTLRRFKKADNSSVERNHVFPPLDAAWTLLQKAPAYKNALDSKWIFDKVEEKVTSLFTRLFLQENYKEIDNYRESFNNFSAADSPITSSVIQGMKRAFENQLQALENKVASAEAGLADPKRLLDQMDKTLAVIEQDRTRYNLFSLERKVATLREKAQEIMEKKLYAKEKSLADTPIIIGLMGMLRLDGSDAHFSADGAVRLQLNDAESSLPLLGADLAIGTDTSGTSFTSATIGLYPEHHQLSPYAGMRLAAFNDFENFSPDVMIGAVLPITSNAEIDAGLRLSLSQPDRDFANVGLRLEW